MSALWILAGVVWWLTGFASYLAAEWFLAGDDIRVRTVAWATLWGFTGPLLPAFAVTLALCGVAGLVFTGNFAERVIYGQKRKDQSS